MAQGIFDHLNEAFLITTQGLELNAYYRRIMTKLVQASGSLAATLWLLQNEELVLVDHIEARQGVLQQLRLPEDKQAEALKKIFGEGTPLVLTSGETSDPPENRHSVLFLRLPGVRGPVGVLRVISAPLNEADAKSLVSFSACMLNYSILYETLRQANRQNFERSILEKLGRSSVAIHSSTLSTRFSSTAVNTATEVLNTERVCLLVRDKKGKIGLDAVSSVDVPDKKSAWTRALTELGEDASALEEPVRYVEGATDVNEVLPVIRDRLTAYVQISGCKTVLVLPLRSRRGPIGLLLMETWKEGGLNEFETAAAGVYASHVAIALDNLQFFERVPMSAVYARRRDKDLSRLKPRRHLAKNLKWILLALLLIGVVSYFGFVVVDETVNCECEVGPVEQAVVVPRITGEIDKVFFGKGTTVKQNETILFKFKTERLALREAKLEYEIEQLHRQRKRLLGEAHILEKRGEQYGAKIAEAEAKSAEIKAKEIELELTRLNLAYSEIKAPISGKVIEPSEPETLEGRVVSEGDPLCRIANLDMVRINVAIEEQYVPFVEEGHEVEISLEARLTERHINAKIKHLRLRSTIFKNSNVFMAEVYVPNTENLKPGMTGKALIKVGRSTQVSKWYRRAKRKVLYWWF